MTNQLARLQGFLQEVRTEMGKVTWPSRDEIRQSTIVVIVTVWLIAIFILLVDWVMNQFVSRIL